MNSLQNPNAIIAKQPVQYIYDILGIIVYWKFKYLKEKLVKEQDAI